MVVYQGVKRWEKREVKTDETGYRWRFLSGNIKNENGSTRGNFYTMSTSQTILIIDCSGFPYVDYLGLCTLKRVIIVSEIAYFRYILTFLKMV